MASRIQGITVQIGGDTTGLDNALQGINKEIGSTKSELKDVERLLKMDPTNAELLRQKYNLLNKQVDQTEDKLKQLKDAEKQVEEQFKRGDIGEDQYNALKREIIETERNLDGLKNSAKQTERAINGVDEDPIEDVAKAANEAEEALEDAGKEADTFGDHLKAEMIVEGAKGIVGALKDISEESKEYMKIMGSLEVSSQAAGYTAEETSETFKHLYGVLADEQSAATTTANLQAIGLSQQDLVSMTNMAIGAWSKYGDSIPIDGLAEALNETVKTGQATGVFCDLLTWAGENEDAFNEKLAACTTETERANLVMQTMAKQGLAQAGEAWMDNNEALVDSNNAHADLQEQLAILGETAMPVFTAITKVVAETIGMFTSLDGTSQALIITAGVLISVLVGLPSIMTAVKTATLAMNAAMMANPVGLIIAAIVALVAAFAVLWQNCEGFRNFWINLWEDIKTGVRDSANGLITLLNGIIKGVNFLIDGINKIKIKIPDWVPELGGKEFGFNIKRINEIAYLAKGGTLTSGTAIVGEAGPEILTVSQGKATVQPLTGTATGGSGIGEIMGLLNTYLPHLADGRMVVLDTGAMVGEMAPALNSELGRIAEQEKYR